MYKLSELKNRLKLKPLSQTGFLVLFCFVFVVLGIEHNTTKTVDKTQWRE